jgi:hypothetical protein
VRFSSGYSASGDGGALHVQACQRRELQDYPPRLARLDGGAVPRDAQPQNTASYARREHRGGV